MRKEDLLTIAVANYIRLQYPNVEFHHNANERNSSNIEGAKLKKMGVRRGISDITIYQPTNVHHGLFLELKIDTPFKKDGNLKAGELLALQYEFINKMNQRGYLAKFCVGFDEAKTIIDNYMKL